MSHARRNDASKHGDNHFHSESKLKSIAAFVMTNADEDVIRAETIFSNLVAEHNVPLLLADHFTNACKLMFPDSKIAAKFS